MSPSLGYLYLTDNLGENNQINTLRENKFVILLLIVYISSFRDWFSVSSELKC